MKSLVVAAGAAVIIAGCGGSDGLTRKQIAGKANAICRKYAQQAKGIGTPDLKDSANAERYFTKAEALTAKQQKELEALKPVKSVKADYTRLTDATGNFLTLLGDLATAAKAKDSKKGVALIQKLSGTAGAVDTAAQPLGAGDCAT